MKLLLHIGHPKTGTTTLQKALSTNQKDLLALGVLYPVLSKSGSHKVLIPHFFGVSLEDARMRRLLGATEDSVAAGSAATWEKVTTEVERHRPALTVLSAEQFFGLARHPRWSGFLDTLGSVFDEIDIVAYARAPSSYFLSARQQRLKYHREISPVSPDYLQKTLSTLKSDPRVSLHVHAFDRSALIGGDIRTDFATRHLPEGAVEILDRSAEDSNESMSPEAMIVLERLRDSNLHIPLGSRPVELERIFKHVRREDQLLPGFTKPRLRPGIAAAIHDRSDDPAYMEREFGIRFERPRDAREIPGPVDESELESTETLCEFDADRLARLEDIARRVGTGTPVRSQWADFTYNMRMLPRRTAAIFRR